MTSSLRKEAEPLGIKVVAVEPGGFRTDFSGRSLMQSATAIDDYAETAGQRRKENDTVHGTQPGDPARAAQAIIEVVAALRPPSLLLLGRDALATATAVLDAQRAEVEEWRELQHEDRLRRLTGLTDRRRGPGRGADPMWRGWNVRPSAQSGRL